MARISMGYPDQQAELDMLDTHGGVSPLRDLKPVADAHQVVRMIIAVQGVHVSPAVRQYAVALANATRNSAELRLGASPRATLQLVRASRAWAALDDRDYVTPDDIQRLAVPVLAHRLLTTGEAQIARRRPETIVADIVGALAVPAGSR
jgi:MoxR-like ATPase